MKKHNIEQRTDEWLHLRKGKITGTVLKSIMGTPKARSDAFYEIIAQRLTVGVNNDEEYDNPMDRGTKLEPDAITLFEFETGLSVDVTGFCESDDDEFIANSPDGLIGEDEAVEIKCPGGKNYVKFWLTNKVPEEYEWQVIQYFVVNEKLQKLYFVMYNPDIPSHPMHIITVHRLELEERIKEAKDAQTAFLADVDKQLSKLINI